MRGSFVTLLRSLLRMTNGFVKMQQRAIPIGMALVACGGTRVSLHFLKGFDKVFQLLGDDGVAGIVKVQAVHGISIENFRVVGV